MTRTLAILFVVACAAPAAAQFSRPTACTDCIAGWFYFDNDGGAAGDVDYTCASSSYNGHRGSDFSLRGGNGAIDAGHDVVAVADGVVERVEDGHADRCTACGGSGCGLDFGFGYGNHVVINHGDVKTIYAHMRRGSVSVRTGDSVTCGQTVGQIASSGCSTGAHLHLETRPLGATSSAAYDPFQGSCGSARSTWNEQGPYRGLPGATCGPPPPTCPDGTFPIWTCNAAATERTRCIEGDVMTEACEHGCVGMPVGEDDVCGEPPACPPGTGERWQCDGGDRVRCVDGMTMRMTCPFGCVDASPEAACMSGPDDADGDGHNTSVDCDDADASRYPGAPETCGDGVDQNCDGADPPCPGDDAGAGTDAGAVDAGPVGVDAGGRDRDRRTVHGGCTCRSAGDATGSWLFWLVAVAWVRRKTPR